MACLTVNKSGMKRIIFRNNGRRKTIYPGPMSMREAERLKQLVEDLNSYRRTGMPMDATTVAASEALSETLRAKLVDAGLLGAKPSTARATVGELIGEYMQSHRFVPGTMGVKNRVIQSLLGCYGSKEKLDEVDGQRFVEYLCSNRNLSGVTINRIISGAGTFFNWGIEQGICTDNPLQGLRVDEKPGAQAYVTDEVISHVMKHCELGWRTIISLARYGGLRCPSEVMSLRWDCVEWDCDRICVVSPKTGDRVIPIFKRLRPYLEEAYEENPETRFVVEGHNDEVNWGSVNLRNPFMRILRSAGVNPWPKLFNSLRGSCENQLIRDGHPEHVVQEWMGHSEKISKRHYLRTWDEDYNRAAGRTTEELV